VDLPPEAVTEGEAVSAFGKPLGSGITGLAAVYILMLPLKG